MLYPLSIVVFLIQHQLSCVLQHFFGTLFLLFGKHGEHSIATGTQHFVNCSQSLQAVFVLLKTESASSINNFSHDHYFF